MNRSMAHTEMPKSRGSWKVKALYSTDDGGQTKRNPTVGDAVVYVVFEVTEPLLLSPFMFGSGMGKQGF